MIDKNGGVYQIVIPSLGGNPAFTLSVPAGAVCDPNSGYGDWDDPCDPAHGNIAVTATFYQVNGVAGVDFSPELRFEPTKTVTISTMRDREAVFAMSRLPAPRQNWGVFAMLYTPDAFQTVIDDALQDPTLVTHIDVQSGLVWRRIKHFSGYTAGTGLTCDPTDPTCTDSSGSTTLQ